MIEEPALAGALHALEVSPLLPYLAEQPALLKRPDAAFLVQWVHAVAQHLPKQAAPTEEGKSVNAPKSRIPQHRKSLGAAMARSRQSLGAALIDRPTSPPQASAPLQPESGHSDRQSFEAFANAGADFEGSISGSPLMTEQPPRLAPVEPAFNDAPEEPDAPDEAVALQAFEAAVFGQRSPAASTVGPTPRIASPTKAMRPNTDGRLSTGLSTPSLSASPPKSIGKDLLSRSRGETRRDAVPDTPELYMRQPDLTSPQSISPPKSIGKSLRKPTPAERVADDPGAAWDDDYDGVGFEANGGGVISPRSPAAADKSELPWMVGATTPLSGRQLRLTPARQSRIPRSRDGGTAPTSIGGSASVGEAASRNGKSSGRRMSTAPRASILAADDASAMRAAMTAAADELFDDDAPAAAPNAQIERGLDFGDAVDVSGSAGDEVGVRSVPSGEAAAFVAAPAPAAPAPVAAEAQAVEALGMREPRPLDLSLFPSSFQRGAAATQLAQMHEAIARAETPPSGAELAVTLMMDARRVALLLDVMLSRKLLLASGHGGARQWSIASE